MIYELLWLRAGYGKKQGKGILRAGYGNKCLVPPHPFTNFEIERYYQNKPRFNRFYSRDNLQKKVKDLAYVINLDEYADVGAHWIPLYVLNIEITYSGSFGVEHVPKEVKIY